MIADCYHYFHVDVTKLPAHRAMLLIQTLPHYWQPIPDTDPTVWRSAVAPVLRQMQQEHEEQDEGRLISPADLAALGGEYRTAG